MGFFDWLFGSKPGILVRPMSEPASRPGLGAREAAESVKGCGLSASEWVSDGGRDGLAPLELEDVNEPELGRDCVQKNVSMEEYLRAAVPDDIRAAGWVVAVHNDYRQEGRSYTFWLFTRPLRGTIHFVDGNGCGAIRSCFEGLMEAVKGEGRSDSVALNAVRRQVGLPEL